MAYQHQDDNSTTTIAAIYAIALIFALMVMFGLLSALQRPEEGATNTPAPPPVTGKSRRAWNRRCCHPRVPHGIFARDQKRGLSRRHLRVLRMRELDGANASFELNSIAFRIADARGGVGGLYRAEDCFDLWPHFIRRFSNRNREEARAISRSHNGD